MGGFEQINALKTPLRRLVAPVAGSLAFFGGMAPMVEAETLRPMKDLPGYKYEVTKAQQNELRNSSLTLLSRWEVSRDESEPAFDESCNANRVSIPGSRVTFALTAGHCFNALTGSIYGGAPNPLSEQDAAENYSNATKGYTFSFASAKLRSTTRERDPLFDADQIIMNTSGVDAALLSLSPANPKQRSVEVTPQPTVKPLPASVFKFKRPIPGEQVTIASTPGGTVIGGKPATSVKGNYIGERKVTELDTYGPVTKKIAFIAIKAKNPANNPCYEGDSGAGVLASNGVLLGELHGYSTNVNQLARQFNVNLKGYEVCDVNMLPRSFSSTMLKAESTPAVVSNPPTS